MRRLQQRPQNNRPSISESAAAPPIIQDALRSPGQPLDAATRAFMEPRLGHDFGGVRVHTDAQSAESAKAVDALAYTFGEDIVFGMGQYRPETRSGQSLLTHELAHVAQQARLDAVPAHIRIAAPADAAETQAQSIATKIANGGMAQVSPTHEMALFRQVAPAVANQQTRSANAVPQLPPTQTFEQLWDEFERLRYDGREAEALGKADALIASMMGDDAIQHGGDLVRWLIYRNDWDRARQTLSAVEGAWWVQWATNGKGIPLSSLGNFSMLGPGELMAEAERQAATGQHAHVRELLSMAFLFLQMQLTLSSDQRFQELAKISHMAPQVAEGLTLFRLMSYSNTSALLAAVRQVIGFYGRQQRQALAAGRAAEAQQFADLDRELRQSLREKLLTGDNHALHVITLEATQGEDRRRGEGYFLEGAKGGREFVTPLPGTPRPDELGTHPAYSLSMEGLFTTVGGQEDFLTEISQQPSIRAAFGNRPIDMNNLNTRLQVWRSMYAAYQTAPAQGCSTALCSLLRLMERYLKAFTAHTEYNVRDFGVSYLDSQMPEDLAGRTMRDCGVYAVTVAYEVYRTARGGTPRVNVGFQLYHTLEHAMLVILDQATNEHYVVSNDQITGPNGGDAVSTVASVYSGLMGRNNSFTPAGRTGVLSTTMGDAAFRNQIWNNYQTGARLGLRTEAPTGPDDARPEGQRRADTYTRFYKDLERFSQFATATDMRVDALRDALANKPANEHTGIVSPALSELERLGLGMAFVVDTYTRTGNQATVGLYEGNNRPMQQLALFQTVRTTHPLARLAMVLLYAEKLGITLSTEQRALLQGIRNAPMRKMTDDIAAYDTAGRPASF